MCTLKTMMLYNSFTVIHVVNCQGCFKEHTGITSLSNTKLRDMPHL